MNQTELRKYLDKLTTTLDRQKQQLLEARLGSLVSVFPFNEYEYILMFLLDKEVLAFDEYEKLRDRYVSENRYLNLYGLAPRTFGQIWGEEHIRDLDSRFVKPNTSLDPEYKGQYDLWIEGIKLEVKASRAIHTKRRIDLTSKALHWDSTDPFWMNFQQLKLDICDVFIFIGVWVDVIVYWVLSNSQVQSNSFLSHQHRGGIEYQIGITDKNILEFDRFRTNPLDLAKKVISQGTVS
ncbi:MAG: hypothetical protein J7K94_02940 [Dehalococcoidia bacterium]|nr:hypothetical protein [Dehalococcoidia bacterium]